MRKKFVLNIKCIIFKWISILFSHVQIINLLSYIKYPCIISFVKHDWNKYTCCYWIIISISFYIIHENVYYLWINRDEMKECLMRKKWLGACTNEPMIITEVSLFWRWFMKMYIRKRKSTKFRLIHSKNIKNTNILWSFLPIHHRQKREKPWQNAFH